MELERRFGNPQHVVSPLTKEFELWHRPQASDHVTLISYASFLRKVVQTFNAHGFYADLNSTYLVRIALDKLPWSLKMKWSEHLVDNGSPFPGLEDLSIWMDKQARACEHLQDNSFSSNDTNDGNHDKSDRHRGKFNLKSNFRNTERNGNQNFVNPAIKRTTTTTTRTITTRTQTNIITTTLIELKHLKATT